LVQVDLHRNTIVWEGPVGPGQRTAEPPARWLYLVANPAVVLEISDLISDPASRRTFSVPAERTVRSSRRNSFIGFTDNLNTPLPIQRR
jgi:hypothetical protein